MKFVGFSALMTLLLNAPLFLDIGGEWQGPSPSRGELKGRPILDSIPGNDSILKNRGALGTLPSWKAGATQGLEEPQVDPHCGVCTELSLTGGLELP